MTGMYNVLEKLRSGDPLSAKEKIIHEQGLVSVLKQLHDDLDTAVATAYGWPPTSTSSPSSNASSISTTTALPKKPTAISAT